MKLLILALSLMSTWAFAQSSNYLVIYREQNPNQLRQLRAQSLQKYLKTQTTANERALFNSVLNPRSVQFKRSLWILNSTIISLNAQELQAVVQSGLVRKVLQLGRRAEIIRDPVPGPEDDRFFWDPNTKDFTYGLIKISVPEVRKNYVGLDGRGIRVGIIDTGIDATHPDLKGRTVAFRDFTNPSNSRPMDDQGHGTHVAGTIAGSASSGRSIGVAPGAELVIAKAFNAGGQSEDTQLLLALQWMADPDGNSETQDHVNVVNNSWGSYGGLGQLTPESDPFCAILNRLRAMNVIPVFAAGNDGSANTIRVPGACPDSLTVAATNSRDSIASFSSRGPSRWKNQVVQKPDLSAPGDKIISARNGGGYTSKSGTSMATPHVVGALAILMQPLDPSLRSSAEGLLKNSTDDLGNSGFDNTFGMGRINLSKALAR